ncbi:MAG TPA: hypothetical protein VIF09_24420 [Polyangiaceae bacterium]|jgi:hypothetical protein
MPRPDLRLLATALACAVLLAATPASAQRYEPEPSYATQLGFDLEGAIPVNPPTSPQNNEIRGGGGFKVRLGEQFPFGGIRFTPELLYGYDHLWANDDTGAAYGWDVSRVFGGARLSLGRILVPVLYGHLGYGWRQTGDQTVTGSASGLGFDVGGALDLRVVPHFGAGVHVEYTNVETQLETPQWIAVGLHADAIF